MVLVIVDMPHHGFLNRDPKAVRQAHQSSAISASQKIDSSYPACYSNIYCEYYRDYVYTFELIKLRNQFMAIMCLTSAQQDCVSRLIEHFEVEKYR